MAGAQPEFLGVDIGATKVEICLFNGDYAVVQSQREPTASFSFGVPEDLRKVGDIIEANLVPGIEKIGVGMKGSIREGIVIHSSLFGGEVNYPLAFNLNERFGPPVVVENDVNSMARAEQRFGAGQRVESFLLVSLGSGIRTAFVERGVLLRGFQRNAGEVAGQKYYIPGLKMRPLCLEEIVGGHGLARLYWELSGRDCSAEELFSRAGEDVIAERLVSMFIDQLTWFLIEASGFYNPEVIILAGSLTGSAPVFLPRLRNLYTDATHPLLRAREIGISPVRHAVCLGAVLLGDQAL